MTEDIQPTTAAEAASPTGGRAGAGGVRRRRPGAADRSEGPAAHRRPRAGQAVPHPPRRDRARRPDRRARGLGRHLDGQHRLPGVPAAAGRLRALDAARRAGHLPQGRRPDRRLRRRRPRHAGARGRRRVRRADLLAAARRRQQRARSPATSGGRTSPTSPGPTSARSSARCRPTGRCAWATSPTTRPRRSSTAWCSTCSSRGRCCRPSPRRCGPGGVLVGYVATIDPAVHLRRGAARPGRVDRAATPGSRCCGPGTRWGWPSARSTGWSPTRRSSSRARRLAEGAVAPMRQRRPQKYAQKSERPAGADVTARYRAPASRRRSVGGRV